MTICFLTPRGVKVAHPLMLRAIAVSKKKNDRIDAGKIADCVRCDFLPECHMASTEIRDRRRTLRYRNLVIKQMVQMKNRVSGLLMETGVSYNKQRLHKVGYFAELMTTSEEVHESIRPLLKLSRDMISRSQKLDYALVSSLQRGPSTEGAATPAENCSRRGPDHGTDVGFGNWRLHPVLIDQAGHQLLRLVRRREELSRKGDADADFQAEEQAYPASADRGCQAGAQRVSRTRPDPRERTGEGKSEPCHVSGCCDGHACRRASSQTSETAKRLGLASDKLVA
jgi:hypothetical protein